MTPHLCNLAEEISTLGYLQHCVGPVDIFKKREDVQFFLACMGVDEFEFSFGVVFHD